MKYWLYLLALVVMPAFGQEVPRYVSIEYTEGHKMVVRVFEKTCYQNRTGAWADIGTPDWPAVYLCGNQADERHELDHWRGMRHTPWDESGRVSCATILVAGYGTAYKDGDRICMTRDTRFEWIEERKGGPAKPVLRLKGL